MRLSGFIKANVEPIAAEWERFAATLLPGEVFSHSVLRDDIVEILNEISEDMDRDQSAEEQQTKSEGGPSSFPHSTPAAAGHAFARVKMGFSSRQFLAEFRALRATVIRLWQSSVGQSSDSSLDDLIRFNEEIDRILMDGMIKYTQEIDRSRELFLAVLGHDLRNPLAAIVGGVQLQLRSKTPERNAQLAEMILISAKRMSNIITDIMELARVRLGTGIVIVPISTSIRRICTITIGEMKAIYPHRVFKLSCDDDLPGKWDETRLNQVVSNLLGNAIQHGAINSVIKVTAKGDRNGVEIAVHNEGAAIPPDVVPKLFDSFFQGRPEKKANDVHSNSLGLGLYICKEIVLAHRGTIEVQSSDDEGTTFMVRLPLRK